MVTGNMLSMLMNLARHKNGGVIWLIGWLVGGWVVGGWLVGCWLVVGWLLVDWLVGGWLVDV